VRPVPCSLGRALGLQLPRGIRTVLGRGSRQPPAATSIARLLLGTTRTTFRFHLLCRICGPGSSESCKSRRVGWQALVSASR